MDSNTHSDRQSASRPTWQAACEPTGPTDGLAGLAAELERLAAQKLDGLPDPARAERVLELRRLLDRLEGHWLAELAAVDAHGPAGADQGTPAPSTASWLRNRLRMGASAATSSVRTARALFRGPLTSTAQALIDGELSPAHAAVLAAGIHDLPHHTTCPTTPPPRPNRSWSTRPAGWTHPGCAGPWPTCAESSTPRPPPATPTANRSSGGCG